MRLTIPKLRLQPPRKPLAMLLGPGQYSLGRMLIGLVVAACGWGALKLWLDQPVKVETPRVYVAKRMHIGSPLPYQDRLILYSVTFPGPGGDGEVYVDYFPFGEVDEVVVGMSGPNLIHHVRNDTTGGGTNVSVGITPPMQAIFDQLRATIEPELDVESLDWPSDMPPRSKTRPPLSAADVFLPLDFPRVTPVTPPLTPRTQSRNNPSAASAPPQVPQDKSPPRAPDRRTLEQCAGLTEKLNTPVKLTGSFTIAGVARELSRQLNVAIEIDPVVERHGIADVRALTVSDERHRVASEALHRYLVRRSPHLVYVVRPRPDGQPPAVFITTREAASTLREPTPYEAQQLPMLIDLLANGTYAEQAHALAAIAHLGPAAEQARLAIETRTGSCDDRVQKAAHRALQALNGE